MKRLDQSRGMYRKANDSRENPSLSELVRTTPARLIPLVLSLLAPFAVAAQTSPPEPIQTIKRIDVARHLGTGSKLQNTPTDSRNTHIQGVHMGAWSVDAFGNDDAADWAYELEDADDLGPIEEALASVLEVGDEYLEAPEASVALAAVEALARLMGRSGAKSAYTEAVDNWVAKTTAKPTADLIAKAQVVISRILADDSELKELWQDSDDHEAWLASISDLRARIGA